MNKLLTESYSTEVAASNNVSLDFSSKSSPNQNTRPKKCKRGLTNPNLTICSKQWRLIYWCPQTLSTVFRTDKNSIFLNLASQVWTT